MEKTFTRGEAASRARMYLYTSSAYVRWPSAPAIYPLAFSGEGTLLDDGSWSTSSVANCFPVVNCRICFVYSSSTGCWANAGAEVRARARTNASRFMARSVTGSVKGEG